MDNLLEIPQMRVVFFFNYMIEIFTFFSEEKLCFVKLA